MYAAAVVSRLLEAYPSAHFYGCAGPKLQALGVDPIIDAASLSIVGLAEVVGHLPRIYGEYRKLVRFAGQNPPDAALLIDNPDFNLRLARHLKRLGVPVYYLVAPQVWAWRSGRVKAIRKVVDKLFCLFPFEEEWFRERGVDATYIGHPLTALIRAHTVRKQTSPQDFVSRHQLEPGAQTVVLLPGSRAVEIRRHLPVLLDAIAILRRQFALNVLLATPEGSHTHATVTTFREPLEALSIKVIENETWDCISHADLALAASGTVTVEAAILGTPMVTFYRVNPLSWWAGRRLVKVPFLSMVNLIADRLIVPELMQQQMTPARIAELARELLTEPARAGRMRSALADVRAALTLDEDPLSRAAELMVKELSTTDAPPVSAPVFPGDRLFNVSGDNR